MNPRKKRLLKEYVGNAKLKIIGRCDRASWTDTVRVFDKDGKFSATFSGLQIRKMRTTNTMVN